MNKFLLISTASFAVALSACSSDENIGEMDNPNIPIELTAEETEVSTNLSHFSLDFIKAAISVNEENKNTMVSPFGATIVSGMIANSLKTEYRKELLDALGVESNNLSAFNSYALKILTDLPNLDKRSNFASYNSTWFNQDQTTVQSSYKDVLEKQYLADVFICDFNTVGKKINEWTEKNLGAIFPSLQKTYDPKYDLVTFINTIYFKGQWSKEFDPKNTQEYDFTCSNGETVKVPMMCRTGGCIKLLSPNYPDYQDMIVNIDDAIKSVTYFFGNNAFAFTAILPPTDITLTKFIDNLTNVQLEELINVTPENWNERFGIRLPKLSMEKSNNLIPVLEKMGINDIFVNCGQTAFSPDREALITEFNQDIKFDLDEKGATVKVVTVANGMIGAVDPLSIYFNKPFMYLIHERSTGTILLAGTVMNPNE